MNTSQHKLYLCENGKSSAEFGVRLASNGVGKKKSGDKKLPLGTYSLGTPRPSQKFGLFIPIGYPTAAQVKQGYTGDAIGIHGPIRWARFLGGLVNLFDTTSGCIGIASDTQMKKVSEWVREKGPVNIRIQSPCSSGDC